MEVLSSQKGHKSLGCVGTSDAGRSPFQSERTQVVRLCWDLRRWEKSFPVRKDKSHYDVLGPTSTLHVGLCTRSI